MTTLEFMQRAYKEALAAYDRGEYPVGAVLVRDNEIIASFGNNVHSNLDPTDHAEILVIREACKNLQRLKLRDCTLYTTLFPCPMCESTILEVGIPKVVYGATTFKWIREIKFDRSKCEFDGPIMENECKGIFVKKLRERGRIDILEYDKA